MKSLFLILSFFVFMISCNSSSGSTTATDTSTNGKSTPGSKGSANDEKGTITCVIDGSPKTFTVRQSFFEISLDVDPNGAKNGLEIMQGDPKKEGFQFEFKKTGTTRIKSSAMGDFNCIINYYNPTGVTYTGNDVTIIVTSYDQKHLTGTFSGRLVNVFYKGNAEAKKHPQYIQVTDGKFDLWR